MKNRFLIRGGLFVSLSVLLMTTSCKKDAAPGSDPDHNSDDKTNAPALALSDSATTADYAFSDVTTNAFYGYADNEPATAKGRHAGSVSTMGTNTNGSTHLSCASVTRVFTDAGFTITLDFGSGCVSAADSILRTGIVTYAYSGNFISSGGSVTATFDHYTVNGYGIAGSYLLTNASTDTTDINADGHNDSVTIFKSKVDNGVVTFPDGTAFRYSCNKTYSTLSGYGPITFAFDSLSITGDSRLTSPEGDTLATVITTPLVKRLSCKNIGFGVESFIFSGSVAPISGTVDFGNGDCDNTATVNIGTSSKTITLH